MNLPGEITPHKVGIALGAGAARGFAHIGVLKVFEKYNLPIHMVAGTSMGAVVGAFFAAGLTTRHMEEAAYEANWLRFYDPILPREGLSGGSKVVDYIETYIGRITFSQLPIPLTVVAADLDTGKEVPFFRGRVSTAVQASASIPGFFVPPRFRKSRLCDGALVNPLPVNHLVEKGCTYIIAVDVQSRSMGTSIADPPEAVLRAFDLMQLPLAEASAVQANMVIRPDIGEIYPLNFKPGETERLIRAGETAAQKVMGRIIRDLSLNSEANLRKMSAT